MTVIEKQYMETVIRMGRRLQSGEIDWEQRRYENSQGNLSSDTGEQYPASFVTEKNNLQRQL